MQQRAWFGVMALVALGLPDIERTIRERGLVHIEYLLLADLAAVPGGRRMTELAGCVQASLSRLSHRIRKLANLGYVEQRPSTTDRRVTIVAITARGRQLVDEITPAHHQDLRRLVFDSLTPGQVESLADTMTTLAEHLKKLAAE